MAKIDLLPRKKFEIALDDGTVIKGQFGTWSVKRYCDKLKISLGQMQSRTSEDYTLNDLIELILCAVEQHARENALPFSFTDVQACSWIDELGGWESAEVTGLFAHQGSELKAEEKKTED